MTTDPRNPAAQARKELGARMRQLRKSAGLTGQALAAATGQHFTRVSRIENGAQAPTDRNIHDWCTACGAEDQIPDLVASARSVESAYLEWARQSRAGMRRLGDLHSVATYQRTTTFRIHEPIVMPGIFQTDAYIRQMLTHLLSLMRLPYVSVGVIPANAQRYAIATIGFWIFDNNAVALETPTAAIRVTRPHEVGQYATMFNQLQSEAIYGHEAKRLVAGILATL